MSSATKALELLWLFSPARPEIGLTEMRRLAKRDKVTTYRHLQAMEAAGFVEQNPVTKNYRLGPALLQLAQTREVTVPRAAGAEAALARLADTTGETAHVSLLSGDTLRALSSCESPRHSIRAIIDITEFPLHATASGLCALAFGPGALTDMALKSLDAFTPQTPTTPAALRSQIDATKATGFGRSDQTFESGIHSLAVPIFDGPAQFAGAISVAAVASRFDPTLEATTRRELITAARTITRNWGGTIPPAIETAWGQNTPEPALEPTP